MLSKDNNGNIIYDGIGKPVKDSEKFTVEDFDSTESIDALYEVLGENWSNVDSEGYTPTCFAILNGIKDEDRFSTDDSKKLLTYTISKGIIEDTVKHELLNPSASSPCNKGKSPLQYACIAMRADAVNLLLDSNIGMATPTYDDMLAASLLKDASILDLIIHNRFGDSGVDDFSVGNDKLNVMHLVCQSQCYASADIIIERDTNFSTTAKGDKFRDSTAYDIAEANNDIGMCEKIDYAINLNGVLAHDISNRGYYNLNTNNINGLYTIYNIHIINTAVDEGILSTIPDDDISHINDKLINWPWVPHNKR